MPAMKAGMTTEVPYVVCCRKDRDAHRRRFAAPRLDARASARAVRSAVSGADVPRAERSPREFRSGGSADFDAHFDQDRRLPRGLRLLPAERAPRHRRARGKADGS